MIETDQHTWGQGDEEAALYAAIFSTITIKQHEVLAMVADNRTSKEIAGVLGITESAVVQRIEAVRGRAGSPPRARLARAYRMHRALHAPPIEPVPAPGLSSAMAVLEAPAVAGVQGYWAFMREGPHGGLNRLAAMTVIAAALLMVAMTGLGVAQALSALPWGGAQVDAG